MPFSSLREILPATLEGLGIAGRIWEMRAVNAWPEIASSISADLGSRSRALDLRGGVLRVRVPDAELACLVHDRQGDLVQALTAALGHRAVQEVHAVPPSRTAANGQE